LTILVIHSVGKWFQYDDEKIISLGSAPDADVAKGSGQGKQDSSKNLKRKAKDPHQQELQNYFKSSSPTRESSGDELNIVELDMENTSPL
jgi:hypothetical protein